MNKRKAILFVGVFAALIFGISLYVPTLSPKPVTGLRVDGLQSVYHVGDQMRLTEIISGYGIPTCSDPTTQIFDVDDPTKPVFSDYGTYKTCEMGQNEVFFTKYYPDKDHPLSVILNKTGVYRLKISWGRIGEQSHFAVIPVLPGSGLAKTNRTMISNISTMGEVKSFMEQNPDWSAKVENYGPLGQQQVVYYTKPRFFNSTLGSISGPQYRTLGLVIGVGFVNNTAIPEDIELHCSVFSNGNKTATDYSLFPHDDLNLTFSEAIQANRCFGGNDK